METLADSIGSFGSTLFRWSALAFIAINGTAVAVVLITRSRQMVNRWTSRLLVANLLLLTSGVAVPAVAQAMKMVIHAVSASQTLEIQIDAK